jgi:hypothetical protein
MKYILVFLLIGIVFIVGCAPWSVVGGPYKDSALNIKVDLPDGWKKKNNTTSLIITNDGTGLQLIQINRMEVKKELTFSKKKFTAGMLPQEVAQLVVDNFKSNPNIVGQEVLENNPETIGGQQGFKLVISWNTIDGLKSKSVLYGFLLGKWYYELIYEAPVRYYYEKDVAAFEKIKDSFSLIKVE